MSSIAFHYAEFKQLEEELKHLQGMKKWDESIRRYYLTLFFYE
jgi:hypothetical protein